MVNSSPESTVLIVDDNVELAENLREIVEDTGACVLLAKNGNEALVYLCEQTVDLIITDMRMPGMDGITLIENLSKKGSRVPVIVMTAYSEDHVIEEAYTAGVLGVLPKPVDIDAMLELVTRVTEGGAIVLLVEDDRDLRVQLNEVLLDLAEIVPRTAPGVVNAKHLADSLAVRVAIIDVHLPDGDGVELGREFKSRSPSLEIVYITGNASEREDLHALLDVPGVHLIQKPFSPQMLLDYIKNVLLRDEL